MKSVTLVLTPYNTYWYHNSASQEMLILGGFFISNFACGYREYQDWKFDDSQNASTSSNCTLLEKNEGLIVLSDLYSELKKPTQVRITRQNFVSLCDEWQEKVCKHKPKEVTIKHENGHFPIEVKD